MKALHIKVGFGQAPQALQALRQASVSCLPHQLPLL